MMELPVTMVPYVDQFGHEFSFAVVDHGANDWGVHFSAFFGDWGDRPENRAVYGGYFHRLKMLGSYQKLNWLFVCDPYGADRNGSYYWGERGDAFVERAVDAFASKLPFRSRAFEHGLFTIGSSMGATGALKFGLKWNADGIIAIAPHIDLDTSAHLQGRERHVAALVSDGDPYSPDNFGITHQIRQIVTEREVESNPLPRLFLQTCRDDRGVYPEQVVPFVATWQEKGGEVTLDLRPRGGHTSDWATRPLLVEILDSWMEPRSINVRLLQKRRSFQPPRRSLIGRVRTYVRRKVSLAKRFAPVSR